MLPAAPPTGAPFRFPTGAGAAANVSPPSRTARPQTSAWPPETRPARAAPAARSPPGSSIEAKVPGDDRVAGYRRHERANGEERSERQRRFHPAATGHHHDRAEQRT